MLALCARYHSQSAITAWSSGTGFAGLCATPCMGRAGSDALAAAAAACSAPPFSSLQCTTWILGWVQVCEEFCQPCSGSDGSSSRSAALAASRPLLAVNAAPPDTDSSGACSGVLLAAPQPPAARAPWPDQAHGCLWCVCRSGRLCLGGSAAPADAAQLHGHAAGGQHHSRPVASGLLPAAARGEQHGRSALPGSHRVRPRRQGWMVMHA